jgi:hypothetical protein
MPSSKRTLALAMVRNLHRWWGEAIERSFANQEAVPLDG